MQKWIALWVSSPVIVVALTSGLMRAQTTPEELRRRAKSSFPEVALSLVPTSGSAWKVRTRLASPLARLSSGSMANGWWPRARCRFSGRSWARGPERSLSGLARRLDGLNLKLWRMSQVLAPSSRPPAERQTTSRLASVALRDSCAC